MNSKMFHIFYFALSLLLTFDLTTAYSSGAPVEVCQTLFPQHGVSAQTTPSPFKLQVDKKQVRPGEKVVLTIEAPKDKEFKGFAFQARDQANNTIGSFSTNSNAKLIDCPPGKNNMVTHNSDKSKQTISLTWSAPQQKKSFSFVGTIALNGGEFWVNQKVGPIRIV